MEREIHFEALSEDHLASAHRLSSQAGWNQTEEDWRRLVKLNPQGVRIWRDGGEVRASFSIMQYGSEVAWIGMILVDTAYRGVGLGKSTFESALNVARLANCKVIGLDATDMGEPIYRKYGFEATGPIVRWGGVIGEVSGCEVPARIEEKVTPELLELDRRHAGADRGNLLRVMIAGGDRLLVQRSGGNPVAYGILREGRSASHLGPVIAESPQSAREIFALAGEILAGEKMICDILGVQDIEAELPAMGLKPLRHLKRMTLPLSHGCLSRPGIYCGIGFEWG